MTQQNVQTTGAHFHFDMKWTATTKAVEWNENVLAVIKLWWRRYLHFGRHKLNGLLADDKVHGRVSACVFLFNSLGDNDTKKIKSKNILWKLCACVSNEIHL